jgi:hypothetical protein
MPRRSIAMRCSPPATGPRAAKPTATTNAPDGELPPHAQDRPRPSPALCTREDARRDIFAYIEGFYNRTRRHSTIGYISPIEIELKAALPCPFFRGKINSLHWLRECFC